MFEFYVYDDVSTNPNRNKAKVRTRDFYVGYWSGNAGTSYMGDYNCFTRGQRKGYTTPFPFLNYVGDRQYFTDDCWIEVTEFRIDNNVDSHGTTIYQTLYNLHTPNRNISSWFPTKGDLWVESLGRLVDGIKFDLGFTIRDNFELADDNTDYFLRANRFTLGYYPSYGLIPRNNLNFKGATPWDGAADYFMENIFTHIGPIGEDTGDESDEGGQEGEPDNDSDTIEDSELPNVDAITGGMVKLYRLTKEQLTDLADFLYSAPNELVEHLQKLFVEPFNSIISLGLLNVAYGSNGEDITIAGVTTGVAGTIVPKQFYSLDCGSIKIDKYYYNSLDYSPYTKVNLYLPFIGSVNLNTDDVMDKTLNIKYQLDVLSGNCVAKIFVDGSLMYTYTGNILSMLPFTKADANNIYNALTGLVATGVGFATTGGVGGVAGLVSSGLSVMNSKESISKGGSCTSTSGLLNVKKPYLTITRPQQSLPKNFKHFKGYTSNITRKLSEITGYTEIDSIDLNGIVATEREKDILLDVLKGGFYI